MMRWLWRDHPVSVDVRDNVERAFQRPIEKADAEAKPVALFDGKTFAGWDGDTKETWHIEDGCIVGGSLTKKISRNQFLATKRSYANFVLRLKFKLLGNSKNNFVNSGVQFRSQRVPNDTEMAGYQADLGDPSWWGCIYDESRRNKVLAQTDMVKLEKVLHRGDWNEYEIRAEGRRMRTYINGVLCVDYTDMDEKIPQEGRFGLQIHAGGPAEVWFKDITLEDSGPNSAKGIAAALQPFVDSHSLAGAVTLVADKDKVLSLEAVGFADIAANKPMRTDALFWIASQSKPITAAALMMLVDEGKVRLDEPVEKYLPEFKDQWLGAERDKDHLLLTRPMHPATVRNILSHTSGMPFRSAMEQPTLDLLPLRDAVRSYAMTPLQFEPGSKYQYSNAGINTAGRIIEVVSGMPYEEFLEQRLFGPLGMKDTTFWPNEEQLKRLASSYQPNADKNGLEKTTIAQLKYPLNDRKRQAMPAGGLFSTASDVDRFCQMMLKGGVFQGKRYLSRSRGNADDEQANRRRRQGELRPGLVHGRRQFRPRRRLRDEHDHRPEARADHGVHGAARRVPQGWRQKPCGVPRGSGAVMEIEPLTPATSYGGHPGTDCRRTLI